MPAALVAGKREVIDLALARETFARLGSSGIEAALTLPAPPGTYTLRAVVADAMGRMTALSRVVELR